MPSLLVIIVNSNDKQIGREREATITMDPKLFKAAVNADKDTALHCATRNCHFHSVKLLIEADPELTNLINNADESPLYLATSKGLTNIATLILYASPSSSSHVGPNGITALHAAVYPKKHSNHFTLFKPLIFRLLIYCDINK